MTRKSGFIIGAILLVILVVAIIGKVGQYTDEIRLLWDLTND